APARQVAVDLEVAPAGAVDNHAVFETLAQDAANMRQSGALGFLGVAHQRAGGGKSEGQAGAAESGQVFGTELLGQRFESTVLVEVPGSATANRTTPLNRRVAFPVIRNQQLSWRQAFQLAEQGFPSAQLHGGKAAAVDIQGRQPESALASDQCCEQ